MKQNSNIDVALLLIRVAIGAVFLAHGADKFSDMSSTVDFFASIHLSAFWAYLLSTVEVVGALAMLVGVLTNWAGIILATEMLFLTFLVQWTQGFAGGYEFDLALFLSAVAISLSGSGKYALKFVWKE